MRIAIIGSGISGLTAAYYLSQKHDVKLYEKASRLGGHTATIDVSYAGEQHQIDTGFIVFNEKTYPNFIRLMGALQVESMPTTMGFSVSAADDKNSRDLLPGLEYAGTNLDTLFAQRKNLLNPTFIKMVTDIVRFNKLATACAKTDELDYSLTLREFLQDKKFSQAFIDYYLVPMGSAIWSTSYFAMLDFSAAFFIRFFYNHGLLNVVDRPRWFVIKGGSKSYIEPLVARFKQNIELNAEILHVSRNAEGVCLSFADGKKEVFDQLVFATHSDEALHLLHDPAELEQQLLKSIPYANNSVVLHVDEQVLPRSKKVWSSWNYLLGEDRHSPPVLTYNMNILQHLKSRHTFCVSLNADKFLNEEKVIGRFNYAHPQFGLASVAAQLRWNEINGVNRTWFCGAYWGNGFHEDGVASAIKVVQGLGVDV